MNPLSINFIYGMLNRDTSRKYIKQINKYNFCCYYCAGSNMLQARLATRVAKPNNQFYVESDHVCTFMLDKGVSDLPGAYINVNMSP